MKIFLLLALSLCCCRQALLAQNQDPLYWKNRPPHAAYWQQDVAYTIKARIDETTHIIFAQQDISYQNNAPDTLYFVYFHLFQNAFVKDAYTRSLEKANKTRPRLGAYEAQGLGTIVENLKVNGIIARTELDNTIMKVFLPNPLLPGEQVTFSMDFETYYDRGSTRRRMQMYDAWGFKHYNGCQWFPKISVYDARFGWDTHQHLGKEFYGDFGSYDVTLDFAANYIVEATGVLQNREQVLPPALRTQLDLSNFADKKWNEPPSIIIPYDKEKRKQWHFIAHHVHDFAFTADPSYRIGTEFWNGIECVALVQEPHASGWQNAAALVVKTIKTFSEDFGTYHYPKMVAADANDGMEYPMLTLDGGRDPGYTGLFVHEMAHNWFYGMVGSNETYRAWMDEGLTQFLTAEGMIKIDGPTFREEQPRSLWKRKFQEPRLNRDVRVYYPYITDAARGKDQQLNTHSDDFQGALGHGGGYRLVYYKTATMLYNLKYVLGDSLFQHALKHYFNQWKFAHPYPEDFRDAIIHCTKTDLNWFFDQWLETTKPIDYGIGRIKRSKHRDSIELTFRRKGAMQMPLDFTITDKQGNQQSYYIPNTWFTKNTHAVILPRWTGWGKLNPQYKAMVYAPSGIRHIQIDTTYRLADINMLNNYKTPGSLISRKKIVARWDGGLWPVQDWKHYRMYFRPDIWYNAIDGIKAGIHFEGAYLDQVARIEGNFWVNTQLGQWNRFKDVPATGKAGAGEWLNYTLHFETPVHRSLPGWTYYINTRFLDGLWRNQAGVNWSVNSNNTFHLSLQSLVRNPIPQYLMDQREWSSYRSEYNNTVNLAYNTRYLYHRGSGQVSINIRAPFLGQAFDYNYIQLEAVNSRWFHKLWIRSRIFGRYGLGNHVPYESALFLAGANPEEMMDQKYTRSQGFIPYSWTSFSHHSINHFQAGGGLNLRGYTGYFAFDQRQGNMYVGYKGRSGAALNLEADFTSYFNWQPALTKRWLSIHLYAFADAGIMELSAFPPVSLGIPDYWTTTPAALVSDLRIDAGLGAALTLKKWGPFEKAKPLTIRLDLPFFLNRPPMGESQYWAARWLIGISRAF